MKTKEDEAGAESPDCPGGSRGAESGAKGGKTAQLNTMSKSELENESDEDLMELYQTGNPLAFDLLYERHSAQVYGYLRRRLKDQAFIDDLFQGTWLKLHQAKQQYNSSFPFLPWLFTICRTVMLDGLKQKNRSLEDLDPELLDHTPAATVQTEKPAFELLSNLTGEQRKAIELRYGAELSFEEIASHLNTSSGNVRQIVSRAIRKLRLKVAKFRGDV